MSLKGLNFRGLPRRLKLFLIIVFLFALGNSSNQFLLLRAKNLGLSVVTVLLVYLFYNLVFGIFAFPIGKISDRIGKKKILIIGYLINGLVYFGFAIIFKPGLLWLLFGIYGLYSAFTEGIEKALVAEIAPRIIPRDIDWFACDHSWHWAFPGIAFSRITLEAFWRSCAILFRRRPRNSIRGRVSYRIVK